MGGDEDKETPPDGNSGYHRDWGILLLLWDWKSLDMVGKWRI